MGGGGRGGVGRGVRWSESGAELVTMVSVAWDLLGGGGGVGGGGVD